MKNDTLSGNSDQHDSGFSPSTGAFGAGKSYLLAVIVLYLVELFRVSESLNHQRWVEFQLFKVASYLVTDICSE